MSDQMSRRGFMGAAATGAVALAGFVDFQQHADSNTASHGST